MMNRLIRGIFVLAGCVVLGAGGVLAEDRRALERTPLADMETELPRLVKIIEEFGRGDLEGALDLIEAELPEPFPKTSEPFDEDVRARWRRGFRALSELNTRFESVDLIGSQPISSAARTVVLIGHGSRGPVQFRVRMFRYQDQWKIITFSYQGDWEQIESDTRFTRLESPVNYPIEIEAAPETDD